MIPVAIICSYFSKYTDFPIITLSIWFAELTVAIYLSCVHSCVVYMLLLLLLLLIGKGWPLNHHFMFDMVAIMTGFIMLFSLTLPKSSEKKRIPTSSTSSVQLVDQNITCHDNTSVINMSVIK